MNEQPMTTTLTREPNRKLPLGSLRAFITVVVVAHHAFLAYHPYAPPPARSLGESLLWTAFPIVDSRRAPGIDLIVGFNETYFMSLMFLLAGVFAWASLKRKGPAGYVRDRVRRLGIPFVAGAAILAPLAYYPAWLQAGTAAGPFWTQWLALGAWPAGPVWFLWVLLAFGCVAAGIADVFPRAGETLGAMSGRLSTRPIAWFAALVAVSAIAYLPMAAVFTPEHWTMFGPFFVQTSRILHYAVYFFAGLSLGAWGVDRGLLTSDGTLARRWPLWVMASLAAFVVTVALVLTIVSTFTMGGPSKGLLTAANASFVVSCASSSLAFIALFLRFGRRSGPIRDSLAANAYGIFLLHYVAVTWLQLALLDLEISGWLKATAVFVGAVTISWCVSAALRRVPGVRLLVGEGGVAPSTHRFLSPSGSMAPRSS
jgi:hypothetical protein